VTTDDRVLVLMPTAEDGERTRSALAAAGLICAVCRDLAELCSEIARGAGVALLSEEAVVGDRDGCLQELLCEQPQWSDLPLVVLAREGEEERGHKIRESMNATLVEDPAKMRSLLSVIRAALRSRHHQYAIRNHLAERDRADAELARLAAESERQRRVYETALSNTADFNYVFDLQGRFVYVNAALLALWGKSLREAVGKTFFELDYPPELAARLERQIQQVIDTKQPIRDETPYTSAVGTRAYEYIFIPVIGSNDEVEAVAGSTRDITERKVAEAALRESEERYRVLVTANSDVVYRMSPDWSEMSPLDGRELIASNAAPIRNWMQTNLPSFEHARVREAINRAVSARQTFELEHQVIRADATLGWTFSRAAPILDAAGNIVEWFGTARDVTERKQMEEALRDADRKKDEFIALLAHELRNPLAPIRTGLQVLRMAEDPDAREQAQAMMDRQLSHMVRLIDDLLDISRINRNKMELRKERITLADVVGSAVETARPLIDEASHELTISLPGGAVYLDADLTRLSQVFGNLLTNSAKYTPKGGKIWLTAERLDQEVAVSVRDTGIGIPAASLSDVFDMFSQVDQSVDRSMGGLGIGLALVKGLVEMHGGKVTASSEGDGKGSTFTVTLPIAPNLDASPAAVGKRQTQVGPGRRILVVDDNRDGAATLAMMLRLLGNEICTANDGVEAVEQAEDFRPDLILMDVGMPRLNGLEATRHIRAQDWGRDMTIVALTGWGQDRDRERSREAGCNSHLVKPVSLSDLERLLAETSAKR
jgi:PAS domain S-box-containing protein